MISVKRDSFLSLLFFLFFMPALFAQEQSKTTILSSLECSIAVDVVSALDQAGPGWYVAVDSPFFSDPMVIDALVQAIENGVRVSINTINFPRSKPMIEKLSAAGATINFNGNLHTKRVLIADMIPEIKSIPITKTVVYVGSDNLTNLSTVHVESMVKTTDDIALFHEHWFDHNQIASKSRSKGQKLALPSTPQKRTMISSLAYNIDKTVADRLQPDSKKRKHESEQLVPDFYEFTSMSFDSEDIVAQVETIMKESDQKPIVRFYLSQVALKNRAHLDRLVGAGAQVFIYNADNKQTMYGYPILQHAKTFARKRIDAEGEENYLYISSTGNLTLAATKGEINSLQMHPDDKELVEKQFALNEILRAESIDYQELDNE